MKVYIGDVVSVNSSDGVFRYLVEDAGRICYVGILLHEKYASAGRVDLDADTFFYALSLAGDRNLTPILIRSLERSVPQPSIR